MNLIRQEYDCTTISLFVTKIVFKFVLDLMFRYKNRPNMNFDDVNTEADQEFEVMRDPNGTLEYIIKYFEWVLHFINSLFLCFDQKNSEVLECLPLDGSHSQEFR